MTPDEEKNISVDDHKYMGGTQNTLIRYYYYLENGLNILNEFRNLFLGILAVYIALKLENILWAILMFIFGIIVLVVAGWYNVHKLAKMKEWLSMRFSTHFAIRSFDYQRGIYEEMKKIRDLLEKDK